MAAALNGEVRAYNILRQVAERNGADLTAKIRKLLDPEIAAMNSKLSFYSLGDYGVRLPTTDLHRPSVSLQAFNSAGELLEDASKIANLNDQLFSDYIRITNTYGVDIAGIVIDIETG